MITAEVQAIVPKGIVAEVEAVAPIALPVKNKTVEITTNGRHTIEADSNTLMSKVDVNVDTTKGYEWNDVNFYDYEGTILYSYSWDEFVEKNEMPPLPTHREKEGLICQEWNYTLEEVLEQGGRCDVGAIYIPSDGNTHLKVEITNYEDEEISFSIKQSVANGLIVHWGDGTTDTYEDINAKISFFHKYNANGCFDVVLEVINGSCTSLNFDTGVSPIVAAYIGYNMKLEYSDNSIKMDTNTFIKEITLHNDIGSYCLGKITKRVKHLNIPRSSITNSYACFGCDGGGGLESISLPNTITLMGDYRFLDQIMLKALHLPSKLNTFGSLSSFGGRIKEYSVSNKNTTYKVINAHLVNGTTGVLIKGNCCYPIPNGITTIGYKSFYNSVGINKVVLPSTITTIGSYAFFGHKFKELICLATQPTISDRAFQDCVNAQLYDFRYSEIIPTLVSKYVFQNIPATCKIIVPDALYDQWIVATNWTTYASRIVKASEFVESTEE